MSARVPITMALVMGSLSKQDADELVDEYRAEVLNEAADAVEAHPEAQDEHMGGMDRAAALLRAMATDTGKASPTGPTATQPKPPFDPGVCTECGMRDTQWCPGCAACKCAGGCAPSCPTPVAVEATQTADFFQPSHTYTTDSDEYTAPEMISIFRVEHITRHPDRGHLRAIGWVRTGDPDSTWRGHFQDEFEGWTVATEAGPDHGSDEDVFTADDLYEMDQDAEARHDAAAEELDAERGDAR